MTAASLESDRRPGVSVVDPPAATTAVVLVLPGGKARSEDPMSPRQLAAVRMRPFVQSLHRHGGRHGVAVWTVRYRYRGWNGSAASPVEDVRWALDEVRRRHGDVPVALVGHSMGGRTAIRAAGDGAVRSLVALAPWIEPGDPVAQVAGRAVLVAHGDMDVVTSPRASYRFAIAAAGVTAPVARMTVRGDIHAMLVRWRTWHRLATGWTLAALGSIELPTDLQRAVDRGRGGDFSVVV